jgi:hypothetical protein
MPIAGRCALDIEELLQETDETKPHVALSQEDISYFIYTSGSPGHEPGVYAAGSLSPGTGLAGYFLGLSAQAHKRAERFEVF